VKIPDGYISADYVTVGLALNEARKLDLKAMALNQYDNLLISKVDNYLNIRKEPSTDSSANIIGKLPSKAAGEILETLDGWYKIKSGSITGYVTADPQYVAVGQEAKDLAVNAASLMAIVTTDRRSRTRMPRSGPRFPKKNATLLFPSWMAGLRLSWIPVTGTAGRMQIMPIFPLATTTWKCVMP